MASSTKGRAAPAPHKTRGSVSPKATSGRVPVGAAATSAASAAPAASAGLVTQAALPLRPPLQAALDDFARELRKALDKAQADIAALRAELTQLRQRHESHHHGYERPTAGGGGHQWVELRFLQGYIDGEVAGFQKYGFWAHGKSTSDAPLEQLTTGPSA